MTNHPGDPIQLTPNISVASASPFHVVSLVPVEVDTDPRNKEIYKQGGIFINNQWVDLYALAKPALEKLMNAAGIEEVSNHRTDDRSHPYVCAWTFKGRWTQPDSTRIEVSGDYELDLRDWISLPDGSKVKGARFDQLFQAELDGIVESKHKTELGTLKGDERKSKITYIFMGLPGDVRERYSQDAEGLALRAVIVMRPHIVSRAQTGAQDRFIRKILNLKSTYTLEELRRGFLVPRSQFNYDRMVQLLGPEAKELMMLQAAQFMGVGLEKINELRRLESPQVIQPVSVDLSGPILEPSTIIRSEPIPDTTDRGILEYSGEHQEFVKVNGSWKPTSQTVADSGKVTEKVLKPFLDLFSGNKYHMEGHLKKHFGKATVASLTWEEVAALLACQRDQNYDPRWYTDKIKDQQHDTGYVIDADVVKAYGLDPFANYEAESLEYKFLKNISLLSYPRCLVDPLSAHKLSFKDHRQELADLSELLRLGTILPESEALTNILKGMTDVPF